MNIPQRHTPIRLGLDVDGVLADFNEAFVERIKAVTKVDRFPMGGLYAPSCWDYPTALGYAPDQMEAVWASVHSDDRFWVNLGPYAGTLDFLYWVQQWAVAGAEVYFITARHGRYAKAQTEQWLREHWVAAPTVLVTAHKGPVAASLGLHAVLDDKVENLDEIQAASPATTTLLLTQPWNAGRMVRHERVGSLEAARTRLQTVFRA